MFKIALGQVNPHVGNISQNLNNIISYIEQAKQQGASLIVFPELAICGYPPLDFLYFDEFILQCTDAVNRLKPYSNDIGIIIGAPTLNTDPIGKNLFNSAYYIYKGEIQEVINKTLLPTYDVFDEYRYFEPNHTFKTIVHEGVRIALTICEDIWNLTNDPLYTDIPMEHLKEAELMINISASPFSYEQAQTRQDIIQANILKYQLPMVYVNQVGANTDLIFDGSSMAFLKDGTQILQASKFQEDIQYIQYSNGDLISEGTIDMKSSSDMEQIHDALILGIQDYFRKSGFQKAILGLSGGIDSALVTYLSAKALGVENIFPVLLPSQYSSEHSVTDSEALCRNLGIAYHNIKIESIFEEVLSVLNPYFNNKPFDTTEENIQSRIRAVLLMALSNKHGYILLNTSNKSELAVGYGTLYGDMCGGLSVIGDLYKTQIFELCRYINRKGEIIPENIINKAPSAELRPNQKDSDSLPDYEILDQIICKFCEENQSSNQIIAAGFEEAVVKKVIRLINMNEYKRKQTPPILRISPRAFGFGRFLPIVAKYNL